MPIELVAFKQYRAHVALIESLLNEQVVFGYDGWFQEKIAGHVRLDPHEEVAVNKPLARVTMVDARIRKFLMRIVTAACTAFLTSALFMVFEEQDQ
ncbi:hypothetical protein PC116_g26114, partial [Phytophthora cactorum]